LHFSSPATQRNATQPKAKLGLCFISSFFLSFFLLLLLLLLLLPSPARRDRPFPAIRFISNVFNCTQSAASAMEPSPTSLPRPDGECSRIATTEFSHFSYAATEGLELLAKLYAESYLVPRESQQQQQQQQQQQ